MGRVHERRGIRVFHNHSWHIVGGAGQSAGFQLLEGRLLALPNSLVRF
jgi:hypothetical protein